MENLDLKCAELGRKLAGLNGVDEKLLTDALAVLEEQGVYAFFLYLKARGKNASEQVSSKAHEFLKERSVLGNADNDVFSALKTLAANLDDLLFARDLLRQALVYARYHVKATVTE